MAIQQKSKEIWDIEGDRKSFTFHGYKCLILRMKATGGHLCGYVGLPKGHKYYRKHYDDIPVRVHGGLTFAGKMDEDEDKRLWYIGFDCAHAGDFIPYMLVHVGLIIGQGEVYRTMEYVKRECQRLVRQIEKKEKEKEKKKKK